VSPLVRLVLDAARKPCCSNLTSCLDIRGKDECILLVLCRYPKVLRYEDDIARLIKFKSGYAVTAWKIDSGHPVAVSGADFDSVPLAYHIGSVQRRSEEGLIAWTIEFTFPAYSEDFGGVHGGTCGDVRSL
jgi:hypothetical protein